jgi:hypothetical protein
VLLVQVEAISWQVTLGQQILQFAHQQVFDHSWHKKIASCKPPLMVVQELKKPLQITLSGESFAHSVFESCNVQSSTHSTTLLLAANTISPNLQTWNSNDFHCNAIKISKVTQQTRSLTPWSWHQIQIRDVSEFTSHRGGFFDHCRAITITVILW